MRAQRMIVEALHGIGRDIRLGIEIVDPFGRPGDAVLERDPAAEVDADPVLEAHRGARLLRKCCQLTVGNQWGRSQLANR